MRVGAIGEAFNDGGTVTGTRAFRGPLGCRIDRQEVVAVDTQGGETIAQPLLGKRIALTAGHTLEGRNRPLIVDNIEDDRGLVGRSQDKCAVEVALR